LVYTTGIFISWKLNNCDVVCLVKMWN